jgi:hypothetical protein
MMLNKRAALGLLAGLLAGCAPVGVSAVDAHEILLYGPNERHVVFYGNEGGDLTYTLDGKALKIAKPSGNAPAGSLNVPGALWVDGKPSLTLPTRTLGERFALSTIPLSSDLVVSTRGNIGDILYSDGRDWYSVAGGSSGDSRLRYTPSKRATGLRGVGQLTDAEADALSTYLRARGPVAVGVLNPVEIPDALPTLQPSPRAWTRTALVVQTGVPVDPFGATVRKAGALDSRQVQVGTNSAHSGAEPLVHLDASPAQLRETWALVGGNQVPAPAAPSIDFNAERVVTFFLGQKPTGGFGVTLAGVRVEGDVLILEVNVRRPSPGAILTQSLTSPFLSVAVSGPTFNRVRAVDKANGQTLAESKTRTTR